ncbi:hypothetical protein KP509_30G025900 [Ceratopteris richardii]|uniref:ADP,ATP carrier protein n=1 Tax=Ceratopteris richardii TaxID=49495 RepID=A0A8T2R0N4_CERRI|nr:hypothetical protein KP509_30G025900 [Ceratopteris richardii]
MTSLLWKNRIQTVVAPFVTVRPEEIPTLLYACASFFFLLSAYFMVIPLRDEAAISLGTDTLPLLFLASLLATLIAAPICSHLLSQSSLSKSKALLLLYRFFGLSLVFFFILYAGESSPFINLTTQGSKLKTGLWVSCTLRASFYIWIALLNLFTTSALWACLADIMTSEAASRLFGLVGAGATLGQFVGSISAVFLTRFGPSLLLLAALFMEFGAQCALRIGSAGVTFDAVTLSSSQDSTRNVEEAVQTTQSLWQLVCNKALSMLEGLQLTLASSYLLRICCFLWLTAIVSSFFYFERANVVAQVEADPLHRRVLLAKINSFIAVFVFFGQLTLTGRLLMHCGVTVALCASPAVAAFNMMAINMSPTAWVVALSEAARKVTTYVLTRPGREVLFTVITQAEKYKAKVFIDTFIQRLGDAVAAGMYEILGFLIPMGPSTIAICALPAKLQ